MNFAAIEQSQTADSCNHLHHGPGADCMLNRARACRLTTAVSQLCSLSKLTSKPARSKTACLTGGLDHAQYLTADADLIVTQPGIAGQPRLPQGREGRQRINGRPAGDSIVAQQQSLQGREANPASTCTPARPCRHPPGYRNRCVMGVMAAQHIVTISQKPKSSPQPAAEMLQMLFPVRDSRCRLGN